MSGLLKPGVNRSRQAFRGKLECPHIINVGGIPVTCGSEKMEFVENVNPTRIRYRCKACRRTLIYDFSNNPSHPYASYGKNKFRQIVERWSAKNRNKGKHPKA